MNSKILLHGNWIYDVNDGWHLAVYPIGSLFLSDEPYCTAFVLGDVETDTSKLGDPMDQMFTVEPVVSVSLHNLGVVKDEYNARDVDIYLICPNASFEHTLTHSVITKNGYMLIEDLGITKDDDVLDIQVYELLQQLHVPHQLTTKPQQV